MLRIEVDIMETTSEHLNELLKIANNNSDVYNNNYNKKDESIFLVKIEI